MNTIKNMKNCFTLLLALLCVLPMVAPQAFGAERMRIIVDTDILAEADDQHALAYTLFNSHVFEVEGVTTNCRFQNAVARHERAAKSIVHLCASTAPVHVGAYMTYDSIRANINRATFDGHAAINFIIERAHAIDPGGRPLYVMTLGKTTNLALALLKDPTIAPKIKAVCLLTRWPDAGSPDAINPNAEGTWRTWETNYNDDRAASDALLENAALELHIVPWPGTYPERSTTTLNPTIQEIYDNMPGLGPEVDPIEYLSGYGTFTCFGDLSVDIFQRIEAGSIRRGSDPDTVRSRNKILLDVAAPMILKNPSYAVSVVIGAPRWTKVSDWSGSDPRYEPGDWVLNPNNPRKITVWHRLHLKHNLVMNDMWDAFRNPVLENTSGTQPRKK